MKDKLGRILFRKIGGRIIPIRIKNVGDIAANASQIGIKSRKIVAQVGDKIVGTLNLEIPKKGVSATIQSVNVHPNFRNFGIAKNLFDRAAKFASRIGKKFIRGEEIQHIAQIKIRGKFGWYKAGGIPKRRTRFIADQFGPYGEHTRRIPSRVAKDILKGMNEQGRQIKATTMLRKLRKK